MARAPTNSEDSRFTADYHYETRGKAPSGEGHVWARTIIAVIGALLLVGGAVYGAGTLVAVKADRNDVEKAVEAHESRPHKETEEEIDSVRGQLQEIRTDQRLIQKDVEQISETVERIDKRLESRRDRRRRRARER